MKQRHQPGFGGLAVLDQIDPNEQMNPLIQQFFKSLCVGTHGKPAAICGGARISGISCNAGA